ncbi:MAG: ribonuclease P [Methanomicrobiaceae archaeon]|nr:ribonuclease P [Methanomicrobiaceae archaeon]
MAYSDACVFPYPSGDTSVRRFAIEARYMGFDSIVCADGGFSGDIFGVRVYRALCVKAKNQNDLVRAIRKSGFRPDIVLAEAGDTSFNRAALSTGGVDILRGIHDAGRRAFDDVCARKAVENFIAVDIDLSAIICRKGVSRQKALESFAEILKFQRKFGFMISISSGASSYINMRSADEIMSICGIFGMEKDEAASALGSVDSIINRQPVVGVISE